MLLTNTLSLPYLMTERKARAEETMATVNSKTGRDGGRRACGWTCSKGHYCANDEASCPWHNDNMIDFHGGERCVSCKNAADEDDRREAARQSATVAVSAPVTCPFCHAIDVSPCAEWEARSLEPHDRENVAKVQEWQCHGCAVSFWIGDEPAKVQQ